MKYTVPGSLGKNYLILLKFVFLIWHLFQWRIFRLFLEKADLLSSLIGTSPIVDIISILRFLTAVLGILKNQNSWLWEESQKFQIFLGFVSQKEYKAGFFFQKFWPWYLCKKVFTFFSIFLNYVELKTSSLTEIVWKEIFTHTWLNPTRMSQNFNQF